MASIVCKYYNFQLDNSILNFHHKHTCFHQTKGLNWLDMNNLDFISSFDQDSSIDIDVL